MKTRTKTGLNEILLSFCCVLIASILHLLREHGYWLPFIIVGIFTLAAIFFAMGVMKIKGWKIFY